MVECEHCGDIVPEVWRYSNGVHDGTDRRVAWRCRGCHPEVVAGSHTGAGTPRAVADGGVPQLGCPVCGGSTIDGQGMRACTDCSWSGTRRTN